MASNGTFNGIRYDIEVWQGDTGLKSVRGRISASPEAGPATLTLEDGNEVSVFVTTPGPRGADIQVNGPVPEFDS